ncbi:MAG: DEAD/DEAH box helicase [Planctomycetota bacterium]|nr:DEAD/DEAH box helicase [Planctomycetota bacterium]MDP6939983.1 DEAD/DEAH box helicase [Planctomycetota bacterium]
MLDVPPIETFAEWDLGAEVQAAIAGMDIVKPTPIQALTIGPVLEGKDAIAKAETGTGKTLAFGAPMIAKVDAGRTTVLGLVLSPTRELSEQVHEVLKELGAARGIKTALIVGGEPMRPQVLALQDGAQVVVGTPGRVLDLMNQGFLSFPWTEFAVLDEADKMLEIGFIDDIAKILAACNEERQTLLFSATFPPPLLKLARAYTKDPIEVATASGMATVDNISQFHLKVTDENRVRGLSMMINSSAEDDVFLVFCERRTDVDRLMRRLERERFSVKALHGGYDQASRFRVMTAFRTGEVKVLLATDVASRGLDVKHVTHVVNFGVPRDIADYTHRIGRTGRAGRDGTAVTLVGPEDGRRWSSLRAQASYEIAEADNPRSVHPKRKPGEKKSPSPEKAKPETSSPEPEPPTDTGLDQVSEPTESPTAGFGLGIMGSEPSVADSPPEPPATPEPQPGSEAAHDAGPETDPEAETDTGSGFGAGL